MFVLNKCYGHEPHWSERPNCVFRPCIEDTINLKWYYWTSLVMETSWRRSVLLKLSFIFFSEPHYPGGWDPSKTNERGQRELSADSSSPGPASQPVTVSRNRSTLKLALRRFSAGLAITSLEARIIWMGSNVAFCSITMGILLLGVVTRWPFSALDRITTQLIWDEIWYIFVNAPYFNALRVESEERMVFLGGHPAKYWPPSFAWYTGERWWTSVCNHSV